MLGFLMVMGLTALVFALVLDGTPPLAAATALCTAHLPSSSAGWPYSTCPPTAVDMKSNAHQQQRCYQSAHSSTTIPARACFNWSVADETPAVFNSCRTSIHLDSFSSKTGPDDQHSTMSIQRNLKNFISNCFVEVKVREATSNDPRGPSLASMSEISELTYVVHSISGLMDAIWKRMSDQGKNWRHVYKSLVLLEFLLKTGDERVFRRTFLYMRKIRTLHDFQYVEDGNDRGAVVREKAKQVLVLLQNDQLLMEEREKTISARRAFQTCASVWEAFSEAALCPGVLEAGISYVPLTPAETSCSVLSVADDTPSTSPLYVTIKNNMTDVLWFCDRNQVQQLEESARCEIRRDGDTFSLTVFSMVRADSLDYMCISVNGVGQCAQGFMVTVDAICRLHCFERFAKREKIHNCSSGDDEWNKIDQQTKPDTGKEEEKVDSDAALYAGVSKAGKVSCFAITPAETTCFDSSVADETRAVSSPSPHEVSRNVANSGMFTSNDRERIPKMKTSGDSGFRHALLENDVDGDFDRLCHRSRRRSSSVAEASNDSSSSAASSNPFLSASAAGWPSSTCQLTSVYVKSNSPHHQQRSASVQSIVTLPSGPCPRISCRHQLFHTPVPLSHSGNPFLAFTNKTGCLSETCSRSVEVLHGQKLSSVDYRRLYFPPATSGATNEKQDMLPIIAIVVAIVALFFAFTAKIKVDGQCDYECHKCNISFICEHTYKTHMSQEHRSNV